MLNLDDYKKIITPFVPDITDMELYDIINHEESLEDTQIHQINIRGISLIFDSTTFELFEWDFGVNPPNDVGNLIFNNKYLNDLIEETGYEFK
jgi:hypothetical protein